MREIKFRAWDTEKNKMFIPDYISEVGVACLVEVSTCMDGHDRLSDPEEVDDSILMQYTGLHDKHGKEIYEGDIVAFVFDHNPSIGEVVLEEGRYIVKNKTVRWLSVLSQSTIIIGNIYENPELLEGRGEK